LTRMDHRLAEASQASLKVLKGDPKMVMEMESNSHPPSPSRTTIMREARPKRVSLPTAQFSFGTDGSAVPTPVAGSTPSAETNASLSLAQRPLMAAPSVSGNSVTPAATTAAANGPFQPPLNVLVVDDDTLTRKLMSRMLARNGCNVETAENGKAALELAMSARNPFTFTVGEKPRRVQTPYETEGSRYDLIFLDNQMPVMSGVDMVRKLRSLGKRDYVVGVTGNALKEDQEEYIDAGVDAVLTKPVKEEYLKNCLNAADARRRERQPP